MNKLQRVCVTLLSILGVQSCQTATTPESDMCDIGDAIAIDGTRHLALIVGVGDYANESVTDLPGTLADANGIYQLLTNTYNFPKENICMLQNEAATSDNFRNAFKEALVDRARENDVAVVFYAGHGSQVTDQNGDEPDEWDETFVFHNADGWGADELVDDDFHKMLQQLHAKTRNIVAIVDSCNSGTSTRGDSELQARFLPRTARTATPTSSGDDGGGDGGGDWAPDSLPGLVALTAASDGTPALETAESGVFTGALIQVLSRPRAGIMTYAQLSRQVPPLVAANSYQIPYFQGDLNRAVFGNRSGTRAAGWDVIDVDPLEIGGPPLTGAGRGAEFRVYDGAATPGDLGDPAKAKATVVVTESTGLNARAVIATEMPGAAAIEPGDLAVLVRVSDDALKIRVGLRDPNLPGGIPQRRADAIREMIVTDPEAKALVELVDHDDQFELSIDERSRLILRGPENRIRNVYASEDTVPQSLWQHARQRALLLLVGEGGTDFVDHSTLQVQLVESESQSECADGSWVAAQPNEEQLIPLCHKWHVKVRLSEQSPKALAVGGVALSSDGSTFGFPFDGRTEILRPGEELIFNKNEEGFVGVPPLNIQEHILVFGTEESNPVPWHLMTKSAAARGPGIPRKSSLARALHNYLNPGTRGIQASGGIVEDTTWTISAVPFRVRANQSFKKASTTTNDIDIREYTLRNFDVRPYLPDDPDSAVYRVLKQAEWLAGASRREGFSYLQHDWSKASDEANLAEGIDCSRAIWYAFTRAGLDYNRSDSYLATAQMVADDSLMADDFEQCPANEDLSLGDILVYRSDVRNDGHVVMVIDPAKRIAWGSHGWDGSAKESDYKIKAETGVEFQRIKYKQDWRKWDRPDMELKGCWRYKRFDDEAKSGISLPGLGALGRVCSGSRCQL